MTNTSREMADVVSKVRRAWSSSRVSLEAAFDIITAAPGITFDNWASRAYPVHSTAPLPLRRAARQKARIALSRLSREGRIEKRYSLSGKMLLYVAGAVPKGGRDKNTDHYLLEKRLPPHSSDAKIEEAIKNATSPGTPNEGTEP